MENKSRMWRSGLSLILVLCMVISMYPVTAFAAISTSGPATKGVADVNGDNVITYVSFGDSVTNGYGMEGYRFDDGTNVFGFRREPAASYPALIRDYLTAQGKTVHLEQMAISGFRMDELHWMLCDDYVADSYHNSFFATWNNTVVKRLMSKENAFKAKYESQYNGTVDSANKIIMTEYRNAVKSADLITIDLGTNNFGTFVTNTIQDILGLKTLDYSVDFAQYVDSATAKSLDAMLSNLVAGMVGANSGKSHELALTLARCLMFGYLGFTEHYDAALDAIYKLNPNAQVVVIDCYSMITGVELEGGALGENLDLDELYNMFVNLANFYSRELSPYAEKVTHASLSGAPELFIDYYKDYPDADYPNNQYLHPSAERLMNEFIMEMLGYDPDYPEERTAFQKEVMTGIETLDGYVSNMQATVYDNVIKDVVDPVLKSLLDPAVESVKTAISSVELVYTAVDGVKQAEDGVTASLTYVPQAEEAVNTAVEGVALVQKIVDLIVENLIEGTGAALFKGYDTPDYMVGPIKDTIKGYVTDEIMIQAGFEPTEENRSALVDEVYEIGCIYYASKDDPATANKNAVLEGLRYVLVMTKGMSNDEAVATANQAYQLNAVYQAQGKEAAVKAALATQVDAATAEMAYNLYAVYTANGGAENDAAARKAAVIAAVESNLPDDLVSSLGIPKAEVAQLAYNVAQLYNGTKAAAVSGGADEATAEQAAVVKCLMAVSEAQGSPVDEPTAIQAYNLYLVNKANGMDAAMVAAIASNELFGAAKLQQLQAAYTSLGETELAALVVQEAKLASAVYAVYKDIGKELNEKQASAENRLLAYSALLIMKGADYGINAELAVALAKCYADASLNGQFNNKYVKTAMKFFIVKALGKSAAEAEELYSQYAMYKNLPVTLSKIAKCPTIYFDALLNAAGNSNSTESMLDTIAKKFMAGTLVLDQPQNNDPAAWEAYKNDSALATLYFRFMAQDGVFTHPSEDGQKMLYETAKSVLNSLLTTEADKEVVVRPNTDLLILGDFIAANENSYVAQLESALGVKANNMSVKDFRINDVRYLVDSSYAGDAYTKEVTSGYDPAAYKTAVKNSDVIVLNVGSMNMGMIAKQLSMFMTTGNTYSMQFATVDNMAPKNLGYTMDAFLNNFAGAFGTDATGALMLAFETYGYGFTTFADCLNSTVEAIQKLNPKADILLVGIYDLLGDAYMNDGNGMHLEMGRFIHHAVKLMDQHMKIYADMTDNVTYVSVDDTTTVMNTSGKVNMMSGGVSGIMEAFSKAVPTESGYAYMAEQILKKITKSDTPDVLMGDADGDGQITLTDAQCIMKYKIGEDVEIDLDACDVYQDGKVDLQDAQAIMQFKVGKVSELPIIPVD